MAISKATPPSFRQLTLSPKRTFTAMLALLGIFFTTLVLYLLFVLFMFFVTHAITILSLQVLEPH